MLFFNASVRQTCNILKRALRNSQPFWLNQFRPFSLKKMAYIDNEASNTRKMRKHHYEKLFRQPALSSGEETDLMMCSSVINLSTTEALNTNKNYASLVEIMMANPQNRAMVSDVDHTLLLKIYFKDPVTLTSAGFRAEIPSCSPSYQQQLTEIDTHEPPCDIANFSGPKRIKCFSNLEDLDFSDAEIPTAAQEIVLTPALLNGQRIALKGSRFSRCLSAQFLIYENQTNTPYTFLNRLCLWGRVFPDYSVD